MSTTLYELSFSGELLEGVNPAEARVNLGKLFKANDAQLDRLFSGKAAVIKNNLELPVGRKYLQAFTKAGVRGHLFDMASGQEWIDPLAQPVTAEAEPPAFQPKAPEPASSPSPTPSPAPSSPASFGSPTNAAPATAPRPAQALVGTASDQVEMETPDWNIAPAGSDMQEEYDQDDTEAPDTSHLSLRPMQGNLVEPTPKNDPPPPDTSHLKLEN
ncbi:hypothetical protein MIB92_08810 [Aestuariirhabdus sp. Z084]|uniref:hypothetical protein n=1 Tax=Aestuariirhabdus haliotis TaxID=2918751 RepID=UPI00201B3CDB|nr:hypothetical protein [Aestuariirhabdus haliotis]MCL6415750.1 hypothetical protein [Aestuariirhabdus haliotis]MCL6419667.1 hypothetical protein [Aestuariirhabdus haliotis]